MPKYEFALSSAETIRQAGAVMSSSFAEALTAIEEHATVSEGDLLLIGVPGFPPVQIRCLAMEERDGGIMAPRWSSYSRAA